MSYKRNTSSVLVIISLLLLLLIPISVIMIVNIMLDKAVIAYGQATQMNSILTNQMAFQNIPPKKVHVGDIDIAYKMFGKGKPLLLIAGSGANMDMWDPTVLKQLSANHTVIIFDNRGKGQTSAGTVKNMTMSQFANETAGLIDALGVQKPVDILGVSLVGFIAQELTLLHPEKVDRLIIYTSDCNGKVALPSNPELMQIVTNTSKSPQERVIDQARIVADMVFPQQWKKEHPNYLSYMPLVPVPSLRAVQLEAQALGSWKGTCDRLSNINKPTLVIVGTDDIIIPPTYSLPLAEKITGAWLVQIKGGGHGLMYQYPDEFSRIIVSFLET